jgi:hypothetical protein
MDIKEAKRKKRNQVLQMFVLAIVTDLWSYHIIKTAPDDTSIIRYLIFDGVGYGWPGGVGLGVVIIIGIICTILFFVELKEYFQGNYKLWKTKMNVQ